ncbi:L-carnitine dehydratase/bile acid-inducible protein F [Halarchaeum acidiphilum MH1-52-1]|uniref:L-carnitine dehydratase/bile acid-inducible protein F n=1 Tax=Halarchaeum acidiphilum MH1-52-1 TaxID=1261545 RepID=U2YV96_9EURY|nr:CoA transferase [Halarchaeum acidiphilum]GAD52697.1 L-carnitine dehydratase/bile acid-inducible protein F [Halarchaeum acidiphilum MH1-52-1]
MTGEAEHSDDDAGPLDGVTVLDASRVLVGPFCTMQLGDLGADVIKVERPGSGDQTRAWHPPRYGDAEESAYYMSVNRNKRSVTLDLSREAGRGVFRDLAADADVLVENFRVGKMAEWGLDYPDLVESNPDLVYVALSGYGEWGPDKDQPAYDIMMQAEGGLMSITGVEDGAPVRVGVALADIGAAMYATQATLAALLEREVGDGTGQKIDVSLLDGQAAWMTYQSSSYFATGESPGRLGSKHPTIAPYQAFETADGYVVVAVASEHIWPRFCEAINRPDLTADPRFETNADRVEHREALDEILAETLATVSTETWLERFDTHDVPANDVNDMEDIFSHPQIRARRMHRSVEHPTAGEVEMPGSPMHFSRTPTTIRRYPPRLGEHTAEVLGEHGYDASSVATLYEEGVLGDPPDDG